MPLKITKASKTYLATPLPMEMEINRQRPLPSPLMDIPMAHLTWLSLIIMDQRLVRTALPKMQRPQYKASLPSTQQMD